MPAKTNTITADKIIEDNKMNILNQTQNNSQVVSQEKNITETKKRQSVTNSDIKT